MKAYIKVENNVAIGNPVLEQNLLDVFGSIPENYAPFKRMHPNEFDIDITNKFKRAVNEYVLSEDGITWRDNWSVVDISEEEKQKIIQIHKEIKPRGVDINLFEFDEQELKWIPKQIIENNP